MRNCLRITWTTAVILQFFLMNAYPHSGPFDAGSFKGRIAYSADGNFNDEDDWAASPVALAIFARFGVKDKLVHFDYNCILSNTDSDWEKTHETSVLGAAKRYGYDPSIFYDCQKDLDAAINSIRDAVNASSMDDPLYFILAGPMQVPLLGILKAKPEKRPFVYCISHSRWNDGYARNFSFKKNKRDVIPTGVNWVQITDQNRFLSTSPYGRQAKSEEWAPWHWMRDSSDSNVRFLWERMRVSTRADCSDAGMAWFLMTGDEDADPSKLQDLLEHGKVPAPSAPRRTVRIEAENFRFLENFEVEDRNDRRASHRLSVALAGHSSGRIQTAFQQPYTAPDARYDVDIRYTCPKDTRYRLTLRVGGIAQGIDSEPASTSNEWSMHTIHDVPIRTGDEIAVEAQVDGGAAVKLDYVQLNYRDLDQVKKLTVGVVQTVIEDTLEKNQVKLTHFIDRAKECGCKLVIFPESSLYWSDISSDHPTRAELDAAIAEIGRRARQADMYVIFGISYKLTDDGQYHNRGVVFDPEGKRLVFYWKNMEVPRRFFVDGVPCNLSVCSDRGYLEHSDLPCLVQGSQIIIDISGGHGGDDGRPDLRWIRYRPWAARTGAYVIVSNPVHDDTDFMGHSPWGGGSAIVRPDGSIQARRTYERDVMIVEQIDTNLATRKEANRRTNHPALQAFWQAGKELLEKGTIPTTPDIAPLESAQRRLKIAAAQIACSQSIQDNTKHILLHISKAANEDADIVAFPELAMTGARREDILVADEPALEEALSQIRKAAKDNGIYVIVGSPGYENGVRANCAFVIGDDGSIKTRYSQLATKRGDLFQPGSSTRAMWFTLKGVQAIVTIGDDADWIELADLAAARGMVVHFHLSYEGLVPGADATAEDTILRKQRNLLMLSYANFGLVVNAADPSGLDHPSCPANGISMIVSREGGHNKPAPAGVVYYLPYQTSVVQSAPATESMIFATRQTPRANSMDLSKYWRTRNRKARSEPGWYEWIRQGASLISCQ